jgi:hypothetical protein
MCLAVRSGYDRRIDPDGRGATAFFEACRSDDPSVERQHLFDLYAGLVRVLEESAGECELAHPSKQTSCDDTSHPRRLTFPTDGAFGLHTSIARNPF